MADFCKTCKYCDTGEYDEPCFSCRNTGGGIPTKWEAKVNCKPQTNADRIRAMSDEELATHLNDIGWDCRLCAEHIRLENEPLLRDEKCDEKCVAHCLEWLKQPAEEE